MNNLIDKVKKLKSLDKNFSIFGSTSHKYQFNVKLSNNQLFNFENNHKIILPEDFRKFILHIGNGGCGPDYGLLKIEKGILDVPHYPKESEIINLSNPFRFDTLWNLEYQGDEEYQQWEEKYFDSKWCDGMLRICDRGCGTFVNLVITGKERGNVWIDDRANDGGIYPFNYYKGVYKTSFVEWYSNWIEESLQKFNS